MRRRHFSLMLAVLLLPCVVSAKLLAVIDRSRPETAQLNPDQLSLLVQTARGEAARRLVPLGFTILSEENTISILRSMGVELATCNGDCEVEVARKLQADWLISSKVVRFGDTWNLQINLFQTATGALVSSERMVAKIEQDLVDGSERAAGLLCEQMGAPSAGSPTMTAVLPLEPPLAPEKAGVNIAGLPTQAGPLPGMSFVTLPAGTFRMGSPLTEAGRERGEVQHAVTLTSFSIMTTEVTQRQWKWLMGNNPSRFKGEDLPVESVNWNDVQSFLLNLNDRDPGRGYRLLTEAEWEYACRAGSGGRWCFGDDIGQLADYAWFNANSGGTTHPVGQKTPNAWGLYDMHGNVLEWCQDEYGDYENDVVLRSMHSPSGETHRVNRGGSWYHVAKRLRCAVRNDDGPVYSRLYLGFRLARTP